MDETRTPNGTVAPPPPSILYVDDEAASLKYFQRAIGSLGTVVTAGSVEEGKRALAEHSATLCVLISDQRMPGAYGNELLQYARETHPHVVRILTTAYSELDNTVDAVNQGQIFRYIAKPWDIAVLRTEIRQALDYAMLARERDQLLREKLLVGRKQILWNRIAAVHSLCLALGQYGRCASQAYLGASRQVRLAYPEPDWSALDYADIVANEAERSGEFARRVIAALPAVEAAVGRDGNATIAVLARLLGVQAASGTPGELSVEDPAVFSEFIDMPGTETISDRHVQWLALLVAAANAGMRLRVEQNGPAFQVRSAAQPSAAAPLQLAAWLDNY